MNVSTNIVYIISIQFVFGLSDSAYHALFLLRCNFTLN